MNLKKPHQNFKQIATDEIDYNCSQMLKGTIKIINQLSDEIYISSYLHWRPRAGRTLQHHTELPVLFFTWYNLLIFLLSYISRGDGSLKHKCCMKLQQKLQAENTETSSSRQADFELLY